MLAAPAFGTTTRTIPCVSNKGTELKMAPRGLTDELEAGPGDQTKLSDEDCEPGRWSVA